MLVKDLARALVVKQLIAYFNEMQDALGSWMTGEVSTDELEDLLDDIDLEYANKIMKELE